MAKQSPKHPALTEKYQSGCMGLISFFDFHQSHPNWKQLSDRKHVNRHAVGSGHLRSRPNLLTSSDVRCQGIDDGEDNKTLTIDVGKMRVKNLVEEEISTEKYCKKQIITAKNHKEESKTRLRDCPGWKDAASVGHQHHSHPNSVENYLSKIDPAAIMEAFCNQIRCNNGRDCGDTQKSTSVLKHEQLNEINLQLVQMSEAGDTFINQKLSDGKCLSGDEASHQSKQFLDALEIINSNKELFLKHIRDSEDSQAEKDLTKSFSETKLSDYRIANVRQCEDHLSTQKQNLHKHFWKKIKVWDRYQSKNSGDPQPSTRMVDLKPGSPSVQNSETKTSYNLRNEGHDFKPTYFSLGNIKRKLKHAIRETRKEQHWITMIDTLHKFPYDSPSSKDGGKRIGEGFVGRNLPSRIYFDESRTARSPIDVRKMKPKDVEQSIRHEVASAAESGHKNRNLSTFRAAKKREPNIYVEAKRHLSKMLSDVVEDDDFSRKRVPTTLERILSSREYPTFSSKTVEECGFGTVHMRFSPHSNFYMGNENSWQLQEEKKTSHLSLLKQNAVASCADNKQPNDQLQIFDSKSIICENCFSDTSVHESTSSIGVDSSPEGYVKVVETSDTIFPGKINILEVSSEPNNTPTTSANQTADVAEIWEENGILKGSRLDSPLENQSPESSLVLSWPFRKVVDLESIKDKAEQPSPVSVLEPFFVDDVTSPASAISQHAELPMQPLHLNFEENCFSTLAISPPDPKINFTTCMEDDAPISAYVRAVLQASILNWDELVAKWHFSYELLDPSLFDQMELLPIQPCDEPKWLFDCIDEVLLDICQHYFGCSPWLSFIEPKIQLVPIEKIVIHEVMKSFDRHLLSQQPPHTLEQLVGKDIEKAGAWMDIRTGTEDIAIEMAEASLEELIMESIVELQI